MSDNVRYVDFRAGRDQKTGEVNIQEKKGDDPQHGAETPLFSDADMQRFLDIATENGEKIGQLSLEVAPKFLNTALLSVAEEGNEELMCRFLEDSGDDPVYYLARYQEVLRRLEAASVAEYQSLLDAQGPVTDFREEDVQWFSERNGTREKMENYIRFTAKQDLVKVMRRVVSGYTHTELMVLLRGSRETNWGENPVLYKALLDEVSARMHSGKKGS